MVATKQKHERRLNKREARALGVAKIENKIEKELLERLRAGVYGTLYKFKTDAQLQEQEEEEPQLEFVADEDEYEMEGEADIEDILDEYEATFDKPEVATSSKKRKRNDDDDDAQPGNDDDDENVRPKSKKPRKRRHLEIEYENNQETSSMHS